MKKIFYGICVFILLLLIAYVIVLNLPKATTKNKSAETTITAEMLFTEYSDDETKANNMYTGKVIQVNGKVAKVMTDKKGDTVIILETQDIVGGVLCTFENKPAQLPDEGADISIKGQCNGLLMDVVLNKCNLVTK